jgi:hypothetical protein
MILGGGTLILLGGTLALATLGAALEHSAWAFVAAVATLIFSALGTLLIRKADVHIPISEGRVSTSRRRGRRAALAILALLAAIGVLAIVRPLTTSTQPRIEIDKHLTFVPTADR